VARKIVLAEVCLCLDDATGGDAIGCRAFEDRAQEIARDMFGRAIIEFSRKRRRETRTPRSWRGVLRHA
jgi:hypothetical protein